MSRTTSYAVACALAAGWVLGQWAPSAAAVQPATEPAADGRSGADQPTRGAGGFGPLRVRCRVFVIALDEHVLETDDRESEVGKWVGTQEDEGWQLFSVDFEMGQKATGFPEAYSQVCVVPS